MAALDAETKKRMLNVMEILHRKASPVAVYLFGSRINGTWDERSDYDLAVFLDGAENWTMKMLVRFCVEVQKEVGDDIELHVFPGSQAQNPEAGSLPNMSWSMAFNCSPLNSRRNCA